MGRNPDASTSSKNYITLRTTLEARRGHAFLSQGTDLKQGPNDKWLWPGKFRAFYEAAIQEGHSEHDTEPFCGPVQSSL
jgi:hypothetical protein